MGVLVELVDAFGHRDERRLGHVLRQRAIVHDQVRSLDGLRLIAAHQGLQAV
jgi:hypothetical protein